jgi:hypothetical protein
MILASKMKNLLFELWRRPISVVFGDWRRVNQPCFTALSLVFAPPLKAGPANPEVATRLGNVADLLSISKYPQFALNLALIL